MELHKNIIFTIIMIDHTAVHSCVNIIMIIRPHDLINALTNMITIYLFIQLSEYFTRR